MNRPSAEMSRINQIVEARLGLVKTEDKRQPAVFHRQIAMWLMRSAGWSAAKIGRFYNYRDHSTVLHAAKRVTIEREHDPELAGLLGRLQREIAENCGGGIVPFRKIVVPLGNEAGRAKTRAMLEMGIDELSQLIAERTAPLVAAILAKQEASKGAG